MRYSQPELLEHLSAGYALGTLTGGARRRFERLLQDRADIRIRVSHWESRLGQLAASIPPANPSRDLWPVIAARTQPMVASKPVSAHSPSSSPTSWLGWLKPAGFGVGGLAAGVLAASALFFTVPTLFVSSDQMAMRSGEKLPQSYVGLLTDAQGNGKLLVSSLRHGKTMTVKVIGPFAAPTEGKLVLWAVPADPAKNGPPFILGPVPATGSSTSQLPHTSEKLLSKVTKLIVTLETDAAATKPSDTVVFSGNCAKLW